MDNYSRCSLRSGTGSYGGCRKQRERNSQKAFGKKKDVYKRQRILVVISAILTAGILFSLILYILVNGVVHLKPELFAWEFNTDNMSMMPAIISTVYITALSLLMAVPIGI